MKEAIKSNINNPAALEKMYRQNKSDFKQEFNSVFTEIEDNKLAEFWNERLNYNDTSDESVKGEFSFVIFASLFAMIIAKIPEFLPVDEYFFYTRNTGFIIFPVLMFYFIRNIGISGRKIFISFSAVIVSLVFINLLPVDDKSDTLKLSCIHLPLFLWCVLGFIFTGENFNSSEKRLDYLRYNGDMIVITGIILLAGIALTGITQGLFSLIGLDVFDFYRRFVGIPGLAAAPVIGTYLIRKNPMLVSKVSPVIAKIFCPLVLITLFVYLIAVILTGIDPFNNREFLLTFNILLIAVMAIIVFSTAETSENDKSRYGILILFLLSAVTIIVNCIALSAILFRISEWGITPNRLAVLGGNVLILSNLLFVAFRFFRVLIKKDKMHEVGKAITAFLPVYFLWTVFVVFIFPLIFQFR